MKKQLRATFLPYNYQRLMYQRLQNLRQGGRTVDEYTTDFYQLIVRNEVHETEDQLIARYIGGLRDHIKETVNLFDPMSISAAHQRAVQIEKRRPGGFGQSSNFGYSGGGVSSGRSGEGAATGAIAKAGAVTNNNRRIGPVSGIKCFACGEAGHRQADCKKSGKRAMFAEVDEGDAIEEETLLTGEPIFDSDNVDEEVVTGDVGTALVVRRSCLTPRTVEDEWLRNNIFQSTCTIKGKVCKFMIDAGSCENIISAEAVRKLDLTTEKHPKPYKLAWLKQGGEVTVSKRALVSFSVGTKYKDEVWCDVVAMDACHLLLGRP